MDRAWRTFAVILRFVVYPPLAGFGLFVGLLLALLYLGLAVPFFMFNVLLLCLAAIANNRSWRDEILRDALDTVRDCCHVVVAFLLAPISVAVWALAPLSDSHEVKIYWL